MSPRLIHSGRAQDGSGPGNSIELFIPALRRYAWALCRNQHEADDLVQDCLARALSRWDARRDAGSLRPWLFAILHNAFISARRHAARRRSVAYDEDSAPWINPIQEQSAMVSDVLAALDLLPDEQKAVLLLIGVEELSYEQAAQVLTVPLGTVMSRLSRGRERLRQLLDCRKSVRSPIYRR